MSSNIMNKNTIEEFINKYGAEQVQYTLDQMNAPKESSYEPLLDPAKQKFTALPIEYPNIWKHYKNQVAGFWTPEEIDFSSDRDDFLTLNKGEQHFIEMILAFFAASDGLVNLNLSERFTKDVQVTEAVITYQYQTMMENVHSEVYSNMLENIVKDPAKKTKLFNATKTIPAVKLMADWTLKWANSNKSFAHRIVAFAIVEGVFFSGAFAAIYWIKKYKTNDTSGKPFMNGLVTSNKFIARDEGLHTAFAIELYQMINNKLPYNEIREIMIDGVKVAQNLMIESIQVKLIGMNSDLMSDYIEYIADRLLESLGYPIHFKKQNPFKFMETIGLADKSNFFEVRATEYQGAHGGNEDNSDKTIVIDDDDF